MDYIFQIQSLKSQLENMKLQMDNIEIQNKSLMMSNPIGEQLFNLSIQLINIGIQAFNIGKNMYKIKDTDRFYDHLRKISDQINSLISEKEEEKQQEMLLHEIQLESKQNQIKIKNIIFNNTTIGIKTNIQAPVNLSMENLFKKYVNQVYGNTNKKISYFYDSNKIGRNDKRTVEEVFGPINSPIIITIESGFMPKWTEKVYYENIYNTYNKSK